MKKLLLALFCLISTLGVAQISTTVVPTTACPNTTHDIQITVTNNQATIPPSFSYTITINVKNTSGTVVKTFSQTYTDGFAMGTSKTYTITDVAFTAAATWTIDGSAATPLGTYPVPSQNYTIQAPPDVTIYEASLHNYSTNSFPSGDKINFYLNGSFSAQTSDGNYTATLPGDYNAKAVSYVYSTAQSLDLECVSANFSNTLTLMVTAIQEGENVAVSVYPNPIASVVNIQSGLAAELSYDLTDSRGTLVKTGSFYGTHQINTETLNAGTYVLVIKNQKEKVGSYKLVK